MPVRPPSPQNSIAAPTAQPTSRGLMELPPEIVLERLLPILDDQGLANLSLTNKYFHDLCNDESLWLERTTSTYSYNPNTLTPPSKGSGWSKRVYVGLSNPRTFVWGSANNGRLGLPYKIAPDGSRVFVHLRSMNVPAEITEQFNKDFQVDVNGSSRDESSSTWSSALNTLASKVGLGRGSGVNMDSMVSQEPGGSRKPGRNGIVELQAGGWSFAARDMDGSIWVWGQLDGQGFGPDAWSNEYYQMSEPTKLPLPFKAESVVLGRNHLVILDESNLIWEMKSYGQAYQHTAASLTSPTNSGSTRRPHHIIQISAGWNHSACLTSSGLIYLWHPFSTEYADSLTPDDQISGPIPSDNTNPDHSVKWGATRVIPMELEKIPLRPAWIEAEGKAGLADETAAERRQLESQWEYAQKDQSERKKEEGQKIVKIASGAHFVLALKKNGEVWYTDVSPHQPNTKWKYLPFFSSPFITHISAQHQYINSYSLTPSTINHARLPPHTPPGWGKKFHPDNLPTLQSKGVIQVVSGDHHSVALTSSGQVYTWGSGDQGQLGLGNMGFSYGVNVEVPHRVYFSNEKNESRIETPFLSQGNNEGEEEEEEEFCFAITAAGWHTGALLLGSQSQEKPKESESVKRQKPDRTESSDRGSNHDNQTGTKGHFGPPTFRVGFAGRGSAIGRTAERNWRFRQHRESRGVTPGEEVTNLVDIEAPSSSSSARPVPDTSIIGEHTNPEQRNEGVGGRRNPGARLSGGEGMTTQPIDLRDKQ